MHKYIESISIQKKARSEKRDEREKQVEMTSFRVGWIAVSIMMLVLIGFRWYFNESSSDIVMILLAQASAGLFYQYKKLNERKYLFFGLMGVVGIILGFFSLLSQYGVY